MVRLIGIGYCRVSTVMQANSGLSLDEQQASILRKATSCGIKLDTMYVDGGESGKDMERPGMSDVMTRLRTGTADVLLIDKLDRLGRSMADLSKLAKELKDLKRADGGRGIDLISANEPFDTTTNEGMLLFNMLAGFAEFERGRLQERVVSAMDQREAQGKPRSGAAPFGWKVSETGYMEVNEAELELISKIRHLRNQGYSFSMISEILSKAGYRNRRGAPYAATSITQIARVNGISTKRVRRDLAKNRDTNPYHKFTKGGHIYCPEKRYLGYCPHPAYADPNFESEAYECPSRRPNPMSHYAVAATQAGVTEVRQMEEVELPPRPTTPLRANRFRDLQKKRMEYQQDMELTQTPKIVQYGPGENNDDRNVWSRKRVREVNFELGARMQRRADEMAETVADEQQLERTATHIFLKGTDPVTYGSSALTDRMMDYLTESDWAELAPVLDQWQELDAPAAILEWCKLAGLAIASRSRQRLAEAGLTLADLAEGEPELQEIVARLDAGAHEPEPVDPAGELILV